MKTEMINIRHTGIVTKDIRRSLFFYVDLLKLELVQSVEEKKSFMSKVLGLKNCNVETIKLAAGSNQMLELLNYKSPKPRINSIGITHVAFTVNDLDKLYKELKSKKIKFISKPTKSPDKKVKVCFCKDPDGNYVELVEEII